MISRELPKFKTCNVFACCDSVCYRRLQHSIGDVTFQVPMLQLDDGGSASCL